MAQRYRNLELTKCFKRNEDEKKRHYNERVLEVENGSFTPLVFSENGVIGGECAVSFARLSKMIAEKRHILTTVATNAIRANICFSLVRFTLRCIRGSRSLRKSTIKEDFELAE